MPPAGERPCHVARPAVPDRTDLALWSPLKHKLARMSDDASNHSWPSSMAARARKRAGGAIIHFTFEAVSRLGRLHPKAAPERHGVEVLPDRAYRPGGSTSHLLDVYRPVERKGPLPAVLYVHGGAFRILSKDTHWGMALAFARRGYVVFNINYRLAPRHRFPAACEDVAAACAWVKENAASYGGDPDRLILAGESAGANLVTTAAVAACYQRPEPWARLLWDADPKPRAVVAACGVLQVTDLQRLFRQRSLPIWIRDRFTELARNYLPNGATAPEALAMADPLVLLEEGEQPQRPLPPFFVPCGTRDPLIDDSRRLAAALKRLGTRHEAPTYPGGAHAFHAFLWQELARQCWRDQFAFLDEVLPGTEG